MSPPVPPASTAPAAIPARGTSPRGTSPRGTSPRGNSPGSTPSRGLSPRGGGFLSSFAKVPSLPGKLGDWAGGRNSQGDATPRAARDSQSGAGDPASAGLPRLTYFNARGRAEVVRIMCAEAAYNYEDYRFRPNLENECRAPEVHQRAQRQCLCQTHGPGNDEFVEFKTSGKSITGQVPLMEIDGLKIAQTSAICRYLADKFSMAGSTPAERAYVDMVSATLDDLYIFMVQSMIERKVDIDFYYEQWPKVGETLERMAAEFSSTSGFFVAGHLTWVDIYGFHMFTRLEEGHAGALQAFPRLDAIARNVAQRPRVKTWLTQRVKREKALGNYIDWLL